MDLLDTTAYFSSQIPRIATRRPLLKWTLCALAAKDIGHIQRSSERVTSSAAARRVAQLAQHNADRQIDWGYQSAKFYHQALGHLKTVMDSGAFESNADRDELFAAVSILCCYELMDAPGTAWKAHLSALPLFSPGPDPASGLPSSPVTIPRTPIKGPIFWHLARQDLLCACKFYFTKDCLWLASGTYMIHAFLLQLSAKHRRDWTSEIYGYGKMPASQPMSTVIFSHRASQTRMMSQVLGKWRRIRGHTS